MRPLRVLPAADMDVDEAAEYLAGHATLDVALRFLEAVREAFTFLCENPEAGSRGRYRNPRLRELRRWHVRGFERYLVFYRLVEEWVEIVRVLHGARDLSAVLESEE